MRKERNRFLIAVLRFHGDVLLTSPLINEIKRIDPESVLDLLVYKGKGGLLEGDKRIDNILEAEPSSGLNLMKKLMNEIKLLRQLRKTKYDYGLFLTTQWRMALMGRSLRKAKTAGVDDLKRRKSFWIKSFSTIFPHVGDNHIIERNLSALKTLGFQINEDAPKLNLIIPSKVVESAKKIRNQHLIIGDYCLLHPVSRRASKQWTKNAFVNLVDHYINLGLKVVITSGPEDIERNYVKDIAALTKKDFIDLGGKTSLLELAAIIKDAKFFIGLDSVASHLAAAVGTSGVTLFGPSNPVNWRPWSDKITVISRDGTEDNCQQHGHLEGKYKNCLCYISPERVIEEIDKIIS